MSRGAAALAVLLGGAAAAAYHLWPRTAAHDDVPAPPPPAADVARVPDAGRRLLPPPPVRELGDHLDVDLLGAPARLYSTQGLDELPDGERVRVQAGAARLGEPIRVDLALSRAAREVAAVASRLGALPPEAVIARLLHASGAPDLGAAAYLTLADEDDERARAETLDAALAAAPSGRGRLRLGLGEVHGDGPRAQVVVALVARAGYELDGVPTHGAPGAVWQATLHEARGWDRLRALALGPRGGVPVDVDGSTVRLTLPDGPDGAEIAIGIDGEGPDGPGKLAQLTVWLGASPPGRHRVGLPAEDPPGLDEAGAEALAFARLLADRAALGAPAVVRDSALDAIARAHSAEMRDRGYFGHRSPTTGLAGDRLERAGYWAAAHGENLAKNDSIGEAQASLVASLGHRANLVEPRFTVVGIGVAQGDTGWYLTQLFARPIPRLTNDAARRWVARMDAARAKRGLPALQWRAPLAEACAARAASLGDASVERVTADVSADVAGQLRGEGAVWVATGVDLDEGELPEAALAPASTAIGVGAWQDPGDGTVGVVVVIER